MCLQSLNLEKLYEFLFSIVNGKSTKLERVAAKPNRIEEATQNHQMRKPYDETQGKKEVHDK